MIACLSTNGKHMLFRLVGCFGQGLRGGLEQNVFCEGCKMTKVCQHFLVCLEENGGLIQK